MEVGKSKDCKGQLKYAKEEKSTLVLKDGDLINQYCGVFRQCGNC
jgi:hypothetical protein